VKLLLDEMLTREIARQLQARGHDVEAVNGNRAWQTLSDAEVMALARAERRAIVTNNVRDFRPLHHAAIVPGGPGHFGMVFIPGGFRRTKDDIGRIVDALDEKLALYPGDASLADAETWL
jgi:predicted nuclease of predicted toxin-antitoxin system